MFKEQGTSATDHKSKQVSESILRYFSGFDAFTLPSPTVDPETMKSINQKKDKVNPLFLSGLEKFKRLITTTLSPKHSFNDGEFVTGEGNKSIFLHAIYSFYILSSKKASLASLLLVVRYTGEV